MHKMKLWKCILRPFGSDPRSPQRVHTRGGWLQRREGEACRVSARHAALVHPQGRVPPYEEARLGSVDSLRSRLEEDSSTAAAAQQAAAAVSASTFEMYVCVDGFERLCAVRCSICRCRAASRHCTTPVLSCCQLPAKASTIWCACLHKLGPTSSVRRHRRHPNNPGRG